MAIGAAVQAGVLTGEVKDLLLLDVTPLTLSIETHGQRGDADDSAQHDHSDEEDRDVLNGGGQPDRGRGARDCRANVRWRRKTGHWASSSWAAFLPAPRGVPQIEVTFDIDANGILNVTLPRTMLRARTQKITITSSSGLEQGRSGAHGEGCGSSCVRGQGTARGEDRSRAMVWTRWSTTWRRC